MHILLRQLSVPEPSQLLALPPSCEHSRPPSSQRLPMDQESEHTQTSLILNDSVTSVFKTTVTQTCLAFLPCEKRLFAAQLFRTTAGGLGWCHGCSIFVARPLLTPRSRRRWCRRLGCPWGRVCLSTDHHRAAGSARDSKARTARERGPEYGNQMIELFPVLKGRLSSEAAARRRRKPRSQTTPGQQHDGRPLFKEGKDL